MNWLLLTQTNLFGLIPLLATTDSLPSFLPAPAQYGILGIVIAALVTGRVVTAGVLKDEQDARRRAEERADRYEMEIQRLNESFRESAIPAFIDSTRAMADITEATQSILRGRGQG